MIKIYPQSMLPKIVCPVCGAKFFVHRIVVPGMRPLADVSCMACKKAFYADLPVGHGINHQTIIEKETGKIYFEGLDWYPLLLKQTLSTRKNKKEISFSEEINQKDKKSGLIVLDCLDTLYGHALLKLFNAQYYLDRYAHHDLLIIVPQLLKWLVPKTAKHIISVNVTLKNGYYWMENLNEHLWKVFTQYDTVYIAKASGQPHPRNTDITRFLPDVKAFDLPSMNSNKNVYVTFITREDRLWTHSLFLARVIKKFPHNFVIRALQKLLVLRQNKKIIQLFHALKQQDIEHVQCAVAGIGTTGSFPKDIEDLRSDVINETIEKTWIKKYAESAVIIGIHGSNLLIPSALGGSTISMLPMYKFGNIGQDLLINEQDSRMALVRYRLIPSVVPPKNIAHIASSFIRGYSKIHKNFMEDPQ